MRSAWLTSARAHLKILIEHTRAEPALNQVELHPFFIQRDPHEPNARLGIVTQSWSALGNSGRRASGTLKDPLAHATVITVDKKYRNSQHAKSGEDGEQTPRAILAAPSN